MTQDDLLRQLAAQPLSALKLQLIQEILNVDEQTPFTSVVLQGDEQRPGLLLLCAAAEHARLLSSVLHGYNILEYLRNPEEFPQSDSTAVQDELICIASDTLERCEHLRDENAIVHITIRDSEQPEYKQPILSLILATGPECSAHVKQLAETLTQPIIKARLPGHDLKA